MFFNVDENGHGFSNPYSRTRVKVQIKRPDRKKTCNFINFEIFSTKNRIVRIKKLQKMKICWSEF